MFREEIALFADDLEAIYKDLHRHPEPGFAEKRTAAIVAAELKKYGLDVQEGVALTGVVGTLDSGRPGKTVMLRADMDCLRVRELSGCDYASENPGLMHACGHDTHVTMLLGAARILAQHKEAFSGRIKFIFQPAEEQIDPSMVETVRAAGYDGGGGAGFMIQEGTMEGVDACIAMHNQPQLPVGTVEISRKNACASSNHFEITITGKGGHGARPHEAVDPVPALCEAVQAVLLLPAREINTLEPVVLSVGTVSTPDSVWNAVAEKACFTGSFRTFSSEVQKTLNRRIKETVEGIAAAHQCTAEVNVFCSFEATVNDEEMSAFAAETCAEVLGKENVFYSDKPVMVSEDAGLYLEKVPGVYFWIGSGDPAHGLHNPNMLPDLKVLALGAEVHATNAVRLLEKLNRVVQEK